MAREATEFTEQQIMDDHVQYKMRRPSIEQDNQWGIIIWTQMWDEQSKSSSTQQIYIYTWSDL